MVILDFVGGLLTGHYFEYCVKLRSNVWPHCYYITACCCKAEAVITLRAQNDDAQCPNECHSYV